MVRNIFEVYVQDLPHICTERLATNNLLLTLVRLFVFNDT